MWRPTTTGTVIAERRLTVVRAGRRQVGARLQFGMPVRGPEPGDPWWCPVRLHGKGFETFHSVAGEDSLQALLLAFDFATQLLPSVAAGQGVRFEWLGETERIVLGRHALSKSAESAILALVASLKATAAVLDSGARETRTAKAQAVAALEAMAAGSAKATRRGAGSGRGTAGGGRGRR